MTDPLTPVRCVRCDFEIDDPRGLNACPHCGDDGPEVWVPLIASDPDYTEARDEAKRLLRGQFAYCMSPETYLPGDETGYYDDIIDKALALAAPDPAPLDVERLAGAMRALRWRWLGWVDLEDTPRADEAIRNAADQLAREYAALEADHD
jgi:hypothetical protein